MRVKYLTKEHSAASPVGVQAMRPERLHLLNNNGLINLKDE